MTVHKKEEWVQILKSNTENDLQSKKLTYTQIHTNLPISYKKSINATKKSNSLYSVWDSVEESEPKIDGQ
jgi:hypothetical protein